MLAQHLREMERDGLVVRKNLSGRVLHVEYSLSESGGYAALHLISMCRIEATCTCPSGRKSEFNHPLKETEYPGN